MEPLYKPRFPPKIRKKPQSDDGCKIEVKRTKTGKKILIGRGCTKDQIQMFKESGDLNLNEPAGGENGTA